MHMAGASCRCAAFAVLCLAGVLRDASAEPDTAWEVIDPGSLPDAVGPERPLVRYGCGVAWVEGLGLVVTHGYRFNHLRASAQWFDDSWVLDPRALKWNRFKTGRRNPVPLARYKGTLTHVGGGTLLYIGGDDGGHTYATSHVWGAYNNDVTPFHTSTEEWGLVLPNSSVFQPRQGHTASLYAKGGVKYIAVFGGIILNTDHAASQQDSSPLMDSNQLFLYNVEENGWQDLTPPEVRNAGWQRQGYGGAAGGASPLWPHPRRSHGSCVIGEDLFVFGGFSRIEEYKNSDDFFAFSFATRTWRRLTPRTSGDPWPSKRGGMAMVCDARLGAKGSVVVHGGALCAPGCSCTADVWVYDVAEAVWRERVPGRGMRPLNRHFHSAVLDPELHDLYIFGGESYRPYTYLNDVWRLSLSGRRPDERLVDGAIVYEGLALKSLMSGGAKTVEELELLRAPEYRKHDELLREHRYAEATQLDSQRTLRLYTAIATVAFRALAVICVLVLILYYTRHSFLYRFIRPSKKSQRYSH